MHNFGFKFLDEHPSRIEPIVDYAILHGRPIEVGLYSKSNEGLELLERKLCDARIPVNAHANHQRIQVFNLNRALDELKHHIVLARSVSSRYSVMHIGEMPMTPRASMQPALRERLLNNLEYAEEVCTKLDYSIHVENIWEPISFYRDLFDGIHARGLRRIQFCFDIGHAKIWSGDTLEDWFNFIDELVALGFRLHCHLHANQGLADEHLSMPEVDSLDIDAADGYYNPYGYPKAFWKIEDRFPAATKVFEVKVEHAIANLETVVATRWRDKLPGGKPTHQHPADGREERRDLVATASCTAP